MSYITPLKSGLETTDIAYIQVTENGGRTSVSPPPNHFHRRGFPKIKYERNQPGKDMQRAGNCSEYHDASKDDFNNKAFENFEAIPDEFRPSKQGKDLLKMMASPKKDDSKKESHQNERNQMMLESLRKRDSENSNSSTIINETRNNNKLSTTGDSEKKKLDNDLVSDETRKQNKCSGMFFYDCSSGNGSTAKPARERKNNWHGRENSRAKSLEKSKLKNVQDENFQIKSFYSNSNQSQATNKFNLNPSFAQNKDEIKCPKYNKNPSPNFRNTITSIENEVSFVDMGIQKVSQKISRKRIQWNSDLCRLKKNENKLNISYEYTKDTKQSTSLVSSHDEEDEEIKWPNQFCKKERILCNDFSRSCSVRHIPESKRQSHNEKHKGFDCICKPQKTGKKQFVPGRHQKSADKFEEKHKSSHCCISKDSMLVRHEVQVFHLNGHGESNRMFRNSYQTCRPLKSYRNSRISNVGDRHNSGLIMDKTVKNEDYFQKRETNYERPPLKLIDSSLKAGHAHDTVSLASANDFYENAATLLECGREISDMIVGSSIAIRAFLDNYEQWKDCRRITTLLFEEFEKNLSQSCNKNKRIIEVVQMVGTGCKIAQYFLPTAGSVTARIIACLSDIVSRMFSSSKSAKSIGLDDFQLRLCLQRDMEATSDIYLYGLQCDLQFQDTCKIIEEFHSKIKDGHFEKFSKTFETGFLKEISLLSSKHPEVFYKRLEGFYKLLYEGRQSEKGESFCKAFKDWPDALTTISHLPRRFKTENWDSSPVLKTWEDIYNLLQNDQTVVEDVRKKIQDCICMLMREQSAIEKYVRWFCKDENKKVNLETVCDEKKMSYNYLRTDSK